MVDDPFSPTQGLRTIQAIKSFMAEPPATDNPLGLPKYRGKGLAIVAFVVLLFIAFVVSLIFNFASATADPMHWTSVFVSFSSIFTLVALSGIAGRYLRNRPVILGRARFYLVAGILLTSSILTGGAYVDSPHAWPLPWAFQGAYADYSGNGTLSNGSPYAASLTITALTANGQNVHLQLNESFTVGGVPTHSFNDSWVSATASPETVGAVSRTYDANLTLGGKTVATLAYVYQPVVSGNHTRTTTIFDSKSVQFPVALELSIDSTTNINMLLIRTNIPGLIP